MSEPLLQMHDIVETFDGVKALNSIDLIVRPGECVGLCGENDAGKSTFTKVLSGMYSSGTRDGEILWEEQPLRAGGIRDTERADIITIHQELMLVSELSATENIYLGNETTLPGGRMDYTAMYQDADELLHDPNIQDISVALPMIHYGGGHQQLVEITKVLNRRAKLLILGEPSSSLAATETRVLPDIVHDPKARGIACIYISHELDETEVVCDTITVIRDGRHMATTLMGALTTDYIIAQTVGREVT